MRQQRKSLTAKQVHAASQQAMLRVTRSRFFRRARNICLYVGHGGEINPFFPTFLKRHTEKRFFLPVISTFKRPPMRFLAYKPGQKLQRNHFGIAEPNSTQKQISLRKIDLVLMPLVAFDLKGNRLGMGGGYYDKTFAFKHRRSFIHKPVLLGLAYDFQQVPSLDCEIWDVPLDGIITPTRSLLF